jgi:AcrR family transcriptional regulator
VDFGASIPYRLVMAPAPKRPRNAAATRDAILQSAIRSFARAGYDGVGVRDIAGDAGVTAMMVNRYFGAKEQLFAEAVEVAFTPPKVIVEDATALARDSAAALVARTEPDADGLEPFLIMLRSLSNPRAAEIVRDGIERHVGARLARQLPEPGRQLRTELMLSVIAGVLLMRRVVATGELSATEPAELVDLLDAVFASVIETPLRGR